MINKFIYKIYIFNPMEFSLRVRAHTHTFKLSVLQSHIKITKNHNGFSQYFSIFGSFHFVNCLMIVVL